MSDVSIVKTEDRILGVKSSIQTLGINPVRGKEVLIKPNFNTADRPPGSTHNDTLIALVDELWSMGAASIRLGERSFPPTMDVMKKKGILPLLEKKGVRIIDFDELKEEDWIEFRPENSHWPNGYRIARPVLESECLVSTCCLKTHQFGGIFTLSLKLHVGVVPCDRNGYQYMRELHGSDQMGSMIAEINRPFSPAIIVLDGIDVFVDGGPMTGKRVKGNVFMASADRVAIDAAGVAMLKVLGSNDAIMGPKIFQQKQIARAAEVGLGAKSPSEINLLPVDDESREYSNTLFKVLNEG
jgi:uncharacterized protein (DUF362 family)